MMVSTLKGHLDNILVDASSLLEFDLAIRTGKVLMNLRKVLMSHLGWVDMPTSTLQQVPVATLTKLQERFLPEAKHGLYIKLVQAFHSTVIDIHQILDEMVYVSPGDASELAKWKQDEPALRTLLEECNKSLKEHRQVLAESVAKEDEFVQVMELGDLLQPDIALIVSYLEGAASSEGANSDFALRLTRAKLILETGEDAPDLSDPDNPAELVPKLLAKFQSIGTVLRSLNATSKGLMLLSGRVRLVSTMLSEEKVKVLY